MGVYVSKVMLSASIALFVSGFHMVGVLKLMCQPVMLSDHVTVGIFIVVYSSIDPINMLKSLQMMGEKDKETNPITAGLYII